MFFNFHLRARPLSLSLSHTRDNVLLSVSTSLGSCAQISRSVNLNGLVVCVCTGRACIVIHPFSALVWVQPDVSSINKTFFFSKASWTFFFGDLERSFFSGTYFACEDGFSKRLVLIFKCLLPFFRRLQQISQRWLRLGFLDVYKFCYAHAHFQDCTNHDTQNIILWVMKNIMLRRH